MKPWNFCAGPAILPDVVRATALAGFADGIAEISHRSKRFDAIIAEAVALTKELLGLGDDHDVLFLQGGATGVVPMIAENFALPSLPRAGFVVTGYWGNKAANAARKVSDDRVRVINNVGSHETTIEDLDVLLEARDWCLAHVVSNETIDGNRMPIWPTRLNDRVVVDMSSEAFSRPHPVGDCALVYAGCQKNLGIAGVTLVIVRKDMYPLIPGHIPEIRRFDKHAAANSCLNTPPTFNIYTLLMMLRWIKAEGGLVEMERRNAEKAALLYATIDKSGRFYTGKVEDSRWRSHTNVTFRCPTAALDALFVEEANAAGLLELKGHRDVGGLRASLYNGMPLEGVEALVAFMIDFQARHAT